MFIFLIKLAETTKSARVMKAINSKKGIFKNYTLIKVLVRNPNAPISLLKKWSRNEDWTIRYFVAQNPNTPIETLKNLSIDKDIYVSGIAEEKLGIITLQAMQK